MRALTSQRETISLIMCRWCQAQPAQPAQPALCLTITMPQCRRGQSSNPINHYNHHLLLILYMIICYMDTLSHRWMRALASQRGTISLLVVKCRGTLSHGPRNVQTITHILTFQHGVHFTQYVCARPRALLSGRAFSTSPITRQRLNSSLLWHPADYSCMAFRGYHRTRWSLTYSVVRLWRPFNLSKFHRFFFPTAVLCSSRVSAAIYSPFSCYSQYVDYTCWRSVTTSKFVYCTICYFKIGVSPSHRLTLAISFIDGALCTSAACLIHAYFRNFMVNKGCWPTVQLSQNAVKQERLLFFPPSAIRLQVFRIT